MEDFFEFMAVEGDFKPDKTTYYILISAYGEAVSGTIIEKFTITIFLIIIGCVSHPHFIILSSHNSKTGNQ